MWFPEGKDDPEIALLRQSRKGRILGQPVKHGWLYSELCLFTGDGQRSRRW